MSIDTGMTVLQEAKASASTGDLQIRHDATGVLLQKVVGVERHVAMFLSWSEVDVLIDAVDAHRRTEDGA